MATIKKSKAKNLSAGPSRKTPNAGMVDPKGQYTKVQKRTLGSMKIGGKVKKAQSGVRKSPQREAYDKFQSELDRRKAFIGPLTKSGFIKGQYEEGFQERKKEEDEILAGIKDPEKRKRFEEERELTPREYYGDGRYKRGGKVKKIMKRGGKVTKAQTGKKLDPSKLERLRVKPVTDSLRLQDIKKSVNQTTDDYLKSKAKAKPKAKMGMKVSAKKGMHKMPNGKMMKNSSMKKGGKMSKKAC